MKEFRVIFIDIYHPYLGSSMYDKEFDNLKEALDYAYNIFKDNFVEESMDTDGWDETIEKSAKKVYKEGDAEFYGCKVYVEMRSYLMDIKEIGMLRREIVLGSLCLDDYKNRFGIDEKIVAGVFGMYEEYLRDNKMKDNMNSLEEWFKTIDDESLPYYYPMDHHDIKRYGL